MLNEDPFVIFECFGENKLLYGFKESLEDAESCCKGLFERRSRTASGQTIEYRVYRLISKTGGEI